MPTQPSHRDYIDTQLQDVAQAYIQSQGNFVAARAFPVVTVSKQTAKYPIFEKNAMLRDDMQRRANGEESAGSGFAMSKDSYDCDVFALHKDVTNQDRANWAMTNITIEEASTEYLTQQGLQRRERQWSDDVFKTGVWETDLSPVNKWTDQASGKPIADVKTGIKAVLKSTGRKPNVGVFGYEAWDAIEQHSTVLSRITGGASSANPANVTPAVIAAVLGLEEIIIAEAVKATNVENETEATDFIAGKHVLLLHRPATPSLVAPSAGYTFIWEGVGDGSSPISVANIPAPLRKADRLEIEMGIDHKVTGSDLGYFLNDVIA